jgi:hypothetical protein
MAIKHYTKAIELCGFDGTEWKSSSSSEGDNKMESERNLPCRDANLAILLCNRATAYYMWHDNMNGEEQYTQRHHCLQKALEDASFSIAVDPSYVKVSHTNILID